MLIQEELERYKRQLSVAGFGEDAQQRLKNSSALIAGIGGIGGTAAMYLASAGIGRLILIHEGNLTLSNLNRQILMTSEWVGRSRVVKAREQIKNLNPEVDIDAFDEPVTLKRLKTILPEVDIVLDCRHNFPERRIINKASVYANKPMIEVAMNDMEGYLFTIVPGITPCLNCLYPEDPIWEPYGFPVLGAVSGTFGCMTAIEAIKVLTGFKEPLLNRLFYLDLNGMSLKRFKLYRTEDCSICGHLSLQDTPVLVKRQAKGLGGSIYL